MNSIKMIPSSLVIVFFFLSSSFLLSQLVDAHQVRVVFEFKDSVPLNCVPRPLPFIPENVTTPASPTVNCERTLTAVMKQQLGNLVELHESVWRSLHQKCSPNAPFALFLYYWTQNAVTRLEQNYFLCPQDIAYLIFHESEGYLNNLAAAEPTLRFPANASAIQLPWQDAFSYTKSGFATLYSAWATQANVFFNSEMARSLYLACLTTKPYIFKTEYDKFNHDIPKLLATTANAFVALYDPAFQFPIDQASTLYGFREAAWNSALSQRPNVEPARSAYDAQTISQGNVLKTYQCGSFGPLCPNNPNPSAELLASFDP
eukprot:TRINITY_DN191_c0_g1_i1.p1 TRINITY_DN191_c0_g1~~TRINITY_DN191_c0_g1_i1.p1  ORF type:complete len:317 (+),score=75.35 TRINITY_DN191_c0_g1_i1:114-1064(+)